jgi:hypothetical protein
VQFSRAVVVRAYRSVVDSLSLAKSAITHRSLRSELRRYMPSADSRSRICSTASSEPICVSKMLAAKDAWRDLAR